MAFATGSASGFGGGQSTFGNAGKASMIENALASIGIGPEVLELAMSYAADSMFPNDDSWNSLRPSAQSMTAAVSKVILNMRSATDGAVSLLMPIVTNQKRVAEIKKGLKYRDLDAQTRDTVDILLLTGPLPEMETIGLRELMSLASKNTGALHQVTRCLLF